MLSIAWLRWVIASQLSIVSDEFVETLPRYHATRSESFPSFLIVTCGYEDCPGAAAGRPFLVSEKEWLRPRRYTKRSGETALITGRSCPYCFRAGRIPARRPGRASQTA